MPTATEVKSKVNEAGPGTFFVVSNFPGPRRAVESAFSRLAVDGDLVRVRRGIYWKGVKSRFGSGRPTPEDVVIATAGHRAIGPTGWLAGYRLGLSTQIPSTLEFAVIGSPPTGIGGAIFHRRNNVARHGLNYLEVAILEVLRSWPNHSEVSWNDLVSRIREFVSIKKIRPNKLFAAAAYEWSLKVKEHATRLRADLGN
jgi:hypothetical protein